MKKLLALLVLLPLQASAQTPSLTIGNGNSILSGTNGGTSSFTFEPKSYTMEASGLTGDATLTIRKSDNCRLIILKDDSKEVIIGCRKEAFK